MFSFLGGALIADGVESGRWGEALIGGIIASGGGNATSGIGGALFADGVRHHNPVEEVAGLAIGAVGAMQSDAPKRSRSHSHHHHHHCETVEERAARERREEEACIARAERVRREAEERARREEMARLERAERERIKLEQRRRETEEETKKEALRVETYGRHVNLIRIALEYDIDNLKFELKTFPDLPVPFVRYRQIGESRLELPETKGETIYSAVLKQTFSPQDKFEIFEMLKHRGYQVHEMHLIKEPTLELFLRESFPGMQVKLTQLYLQFLKTDRIGVLSDERRIWGHIREHVPGYITETLETLIRFSHSDKKPLQFAIDWISALNTAQEVMEANRTIKRIFEKKGRFDLKPYVTDILKFAKQRILFLEINAARMEAKPKDENEQASIANFFARHRGFHLCCQRTKSKEIYDEVRKKSLRAMTLFEEENQKLTERVRILDLAF